MTFALRMEIKDILLILKPRRMKSVWLFIIYVVYLLLGALTFQKLEQPVEVEIYGVISGFEIGKSSLGVER